MVTIGVTVVIALLAIVGVCALVSRSSSEDC